MDALPQNFPPLFYVKVHLLPGLERKTANLLTLDNIIYIGDLLATSLKDINRIPLIGDISLEQLKFVMVRSHLLPEQLIGKDWQHPSEDVYGDGTMRYILKRHNERLPLARLHDVKGEHPRAMHIRCDDAGFSTRVHNRLVRGGMQFLGDVAAHTEAELIRNLGLGPHGLRETVHMLDAFGLHPGMHAPDWQCDLAPLITRQEIAALKSRQHFANAA